MIARTLAAALVLGCSTSSSRVFRAMGPRPGACPRGGCEATRSVGGRGLGRGPRRTALDRRRGRLLPFCGRGFGSETRALCGLLSGLSGWPCCPCGFVLGVRARAAGPRRWGGCPAWRMRGLLLLCGSDDAGAWGRNAALWRDQSDEDGWYGGVASLGRLPRYAVHASHSELGNSL